MRPRPIFFGSLDPVERDVTFGGSRLSLCQEKSGAPGRKYLLEDRKMDWATISKFRMGYVPFSAPSALGGRIVIPIFDAYDNLLGLSVRPIYKVIRTKAQDEIVAVNLRGVADEYHFDDPSGKEQRIKMSDVSEVGDDKPKYWNEAYAKGEHLFGLNLARTSIMKYGFVILVEGQIDVAIMHSFGLTNTVGVLGGGFTPIHAQLLKRWTRQIVVLMDGDQAGRFHAEKVGEILKFFESKPRHNMPMRSLQYCVVDLPRDSDPDSFVRKNGSYVIRQTIMNQLVIAGMTFHKEWAAA